MSKNSHGQKVNRTKLQKKVHSLQIENAELRKKLSQYEITAVEQAERFNKSEEDYQRRIDKLEAKIRLQRNKDAPLLWKRVYNWLLFGVISSMLPLAINVLLIWYIGDTVNLADILADFVLVLFATSMNLLSILSDEKAGVIKELCVFASIILVIFSVALSNMLTMGRLFLIPNSIVNVPMVFQVAAISIVLEAILGVLVIALQSRVSPQ